MRLTAWCLVFALATGCQQSQPLDDPPSRPSPVASASPLPETPSATATPNDYVEAEIEVGDGPLQLAAGFGSVWVENHRGSDLSVIDPATNRSRKIAASVHCDVSVGAGRVWTTEFSRGVVTVIDPRKGRVERKVKLRDACGVAVTGDTVWVTSPSKSRVSLFDSSTLEVLDTIKLPGPMPSIAGVFAGDVWLTSEAKGGTLLRIDPETIEITRFRVPGLLFDVLTEGFGSMWVSVRNTGTLHRIDPGSKKALVAAKLGGAPAGVVAAQGALWVTDFDEGSLRKVDPESGEVLSHVEVGTTLGPPVFAFGSLWVADLDENVVFRIDPAKI